jgi:hypothetical protein
MRANRSRSQQSRRAFIGENVISMEPVEPRCFMSVTTWSDNSISDLSGATYFGEVLLGDDGDPWGIATGTAGQYDEQETWSFAQWDSNLDDGLDSDWRSVSLSINSSGTGGATFQVATEEPGTFSAPSSGTIHQVTIRAAVTGAQMEMDWKNLRIEFYRQGQLMEAVQPDGLSADTMTEGSSDPAESVAVVTTTAPNCDGVVVVGQARLRTAAGTYAGPSDIFGQILVS